MRDEFIKLQNVSAYIEVAWITGSSSNSHRIKRLMRGVLRPAPRARDGSRKHPNQRMYGGGGDLGNICVNYFTCSRWWSCSSYYGATCCGFLHGSCFALPKELHWPYRGSFAAVCAKLASNFSACHTILHYYNGVRMGPFRLVYGHAGQMLKVPRGRWINKKKRRGGKKKRKKKRGG